VRVKMAVWAGV